MRDLLFAILIFGAVPLILVKPWVGVGVWFWVGLMNPHRLAWGFMTTAPVAMAAGLATLAGLLWTRDRRALPLTPETVLLILLAVHLSITTYFAWLPDHAFTQWDKVMKILLMTAVAPLLIFGKPRTMALMAILALSIGFYGFKGGLFSLQGGFTGMVMGPPGSFIRGNTDIGLALVMVLPLLLILARQVREGRFELPFFAPWWSRWAPRTGIALYAVFFLTAAAIVGTHSRGAWVTLIALAPLIFLKMRYKTTLVAVCIAAVGGVGLTFPDRMINQWQTLQAYEEDASAMGRVQAWGVSYNIANENPWTGSGFGTQNLPNDLWESYVSWAAEDGGGRRAEHSIYFQVIGQHGWVGFAIYYSLVLFTLLSLTRLKQQASRIPDALWIAEYAWALRLGILAFLIGGAFLSLAYFDLFFAFVAAAIILRRELADYLIAAQNPVAAAPAAPSQRSGRLP